MMDLLVALEATRGMHAVRLVTKAAQEAATLPNARPIVSGVLRLFGASPATLLSRWGDFSRNVSRGVQVRWQADGPNAGRVTVTLPRDNVPRCVFVDFEVSCSMMLELCGAAGTVAPTEIGERGGTGVIRVRW